MPARRLAGAISISVRTMTTGSSGSKSFALGVPCPFNVRVEISPATSSPSTTRPITIHLPVRCGMSATAMLSRMEARVGDSGCRATAPAVTGNNCRPPW